MRHLPAIALILSSCACAPSNPPGTGATDTTPRGEQGVRAADAVQDPAQGPIRPAAASPATAAATSATGDASAPGAFDGPRVPARFHGVYAAPGRCGRAGDESRLVVSASRIEFHESRGEVTRARGTADVLEATLMLAGEGERRAADYRFRREEAGRRLVDAASGMGRMRCAEKAPG